MKITVELSDKEFEESDFETLWQMKEAICKDLDESRDYPGYNVTVIMTSKD